MRKPSRIRRRGSHPSARSGGGTHNLLIAEVVNAHLRGRKLTQYQVVGELRAVPVSVPSPASEFRFRLKNTHRVEQLKLNEKFVKATATGEYTVNLPAMASAKPVPLIKYAAASRWRPVPLYVSGDVVRIATDPDGGEAGTLELVAETNPQLKASLMNVALSISPPPGVHVEGGSLVPAGSWEEAARKLRWTIPHELTRDVPSICSAAVSGGALLATLGAQPVNVMFGCEGVTISGIEVDVQMAATPGAATHPIAKLLRRFSAGDYQVASAFAPAAAGAAAEAATEAAAEAAADVAAAEAAADAQVETAAPSEEPPSEAP